METLAVAALDRAGSYLWVNAVWSRRYGVDPEVARGRTLQSVVGEQNFKLTYQHLLDRAWAGASATDYIHQPVTDARHQVLQIHVAPIGAPGRVEFLLLLEREVAESSGFHQGYQGLKDRLNGLLHGESMVHVLLTADGKIAEFSPAISDYFADGVSLPGNNFLKLLQRSQREEVLDDFYGSLSKARLGKKISFDTKLADNQGREASFLVTVTPKMEKGVLELFHLGLVDVGEHSASIRYLRESDEYLDTLFRTFPLAALIVRDEEVVLCNPVARDLLKASSASVVEGTCILDHLPMIPMEGRSETVLTLRNGDSLQIELTVSPVLLFGRRHLLCLFYNLSEQKGIQEALRAAAQAAEDASRGKTAFLSTMSHEIRTPLNGILGLLHLAQRTSDVQKKDEYLEKLQRATENLLSVVDDVSDYTILEAGNSELEVEDFELSSVLEDVHALVLEWTRDRPQLVPRLTLQPGLPERLRGDAGKLARVLSNLCSNAVKFTQEGEVELAVSQLFQDQAGFTLEFQVRDTGVGMPPEQLQSIFAPFTQADSSAARYFGGIGLGLFLSKRFVESLGGTIRVESELSRGSRFFFTARFAKPAGGRGASHLVKTKILLVDSSAASREHFGHLAARLAFPCHLCCSVEEAEIAFAAQSFDTVILERSLPQLQEFIAVLRSAEGSRNMGFLLLSRYSDEAERQRARRLGFHGLLSKPVREESLLRALKQIGGLPIQLDSSQETVLTGCVLVVDDNDTNQEVASEMLRQLGLEVEIANNGWRAIQLVQQRSFDAIFMDIQMPGMDGLEATRKIRALGCKIPIIALTANNRAEDREACYHSGMDGFLGKPVSPEVLREALAGLFETRPTAHGASESSWVFPEVKGVKVQTGLHRLGGNTRLYRSLLVQFGQRQKGRLEELRRAVHVGKPKEVAALAHTVKGAAANLGIESLAALSQSIEMDARAGWMPSEGTVREWGEELAQVVEAVERLGAVRPHEDSTLAVYDGEKVLLAARKLSDALDHDLGEAFEVLDLLEELLEGTLLASVQKELRSSLDDFDVDAARTLTQKMMRKVGGT